MSNAILIDTTKCIGCRSCQVSCKQWHNLSAEKTVLKCEKEGLQNPETVSANTYTLVTYHEVQDAKAPGGVKYVFAKRQCMHCEDPACVSACPVTALHKTKEGPVVYDSSKCIGCRYCILACPFGVPTADWNSRVPRIHKCTMCYDRLSEPAAAVANMQNLSADDRARHAKTQSLPACVKQCPSGALKFGQRGDLLAEAKKRIKDHPARYVDHIYGEQEAGGTGVLYMAGVPFDQLGFLPVQKRSYTTTSVAALRSVPSAVVGVGAVLGATYALHKRAKEVASVETSPVKPQPHAAFSPIAKQPPTKINIALGALLVFGIVSFVIRFLLGLGRSTNLSDTYPWGLWIVFDLIWIALAAGAFTMAGLIYILKRDDLYPIGRSAVLLGFLSYIFVAIILVADLGLPWHAWQFAIQAPKHSAMFEVAWCVGLYLSILAFEFLPVPLERWGIREGLELWRRYNPVFVVAAVAYFVFLMSRNLKWMAAAAALFSLMAYAFRPQNGEKPTPIMLAIAAVTLSVMHQSSLGSLFLLMPDKLDHVWWSPVLPIEFLLSAIAGGLAAIMLLEIWTAKAFTLSLPTIQLRTVAKVGFWALLLYNLLRFADLAVRHQMTNAFSGPKSGWFITETVFAIVPLGIFGIARLRERPNMLQFGALLVAGVVVLNRANAVLFAMTLQGPMPQIAPSSYVPSLFEWGIAIAPLAATLMLFALAAKWMPVLPDQKEGRAV